jgi:hypothetical protein
LQSIVIGDPTGGLPIPGQIPSVETCNRVKFHDSCASSPDSFPAAAMYVANHVERRANPRRRRYTLPSLGAGCSRARERAAKRCLPRTSRWRFRRRTSRVIDDQRADRKSPPPSGILVEVAHHVALFEAKRGAGSEPQLTERQIADATCRR